MSSHKTSELLRIIEELRAENDKYRRLVDHSLQGLAIIQNDRFAFCNQAFADMVGHSVEDLLAFSTAQIECLIHPEDREKIRRLHQDRLMQNPRHRHYQCRGMRKDEIPYWMEVLASLVEHNGEPAVQLACMDITNHKRAEESAKENAERLNLALEAAGMGSWDMDVQTGQVNDDARWLRSLGYEPGEIESNVAAWNSLVPPEDLPLIVVAAEAHLEGKAPIYEVEHRIRNKKGDLIWILNRGKVISHDSAGRPLRTVGVHLDITARRGAEDALRKSEERLRQLLHNSSDIVAIFDADRKLTFISDTVERILGYPADSLIGTSIHALLHPDELGIVQSLYFNLVRNPGALFRLEHRLCHRDGRWLPTETVATNLLDNPLVKGIVLNMRDISERNRLQEQLQQAIKMEAVGVLAGGVAHDFNNLLSVINGYAELALESLDANAAAREDLEQITKAGRRAAALTSQLLAFSRKQILKPEILNLNEVIADMSSMLHRLIGEDIKLIVVPEPDLGAISADPGQIQQVLMNMAVNARDAMPQGGKITVETANVEFDDDYVRSHSLATPGPYAMLAFSDNGYGMNAETLSHIFEPFFTTKDKTKGTGLGLSTVYGIVRQSNGFIYVYSEPGNGSTFKIYFPRITESAPRPAPANGTASSAVGSETVLIAEDEQAVRALAARILQKAGYRILTAGDGMEALKLAEDFSEPIHLVVTDVVMPEMSGRELVSQIIKTRPHIKALYISGYADSAIVHHGLLDSDIHFLQKPFSMESLTKKVRQALDA